MFLNFFAGFAGYSLRIQCTECWATPVDSTHGFSFSVPALLQFLHVFALSLLQSVRESLASCQSQPEHAQDEVSKTGLEPDNIRRHTFTWDPHLSHLSCMWAKVILWVCWCCSPVDGSLSCQLVSFACSSLCYFWLCTSFHEYSRFLKFLQCI